MDRTKKYPLGSAYPDIILTQREAQCTAYILNNYSDEEIAKILRLSPRTVNFYTMSVQKRLHCKSREELIRKLRQTNLAYRMKSINVITE